MEYISGTTSSSFSIKNTTIFSGDSVPDDSLGTSGDLYIDGGGNFYLNDSGWIVANLLGDVIQNVPTGSDLILDQKTTITFVELSTESATSIVLPTGIEGHTIVIKDISGVAGIYPIAVSTFSLNTNYGALGVIFTNGGWRLTDNVINVVTADNNIMKIDNLSFNVDEDFI